MTKKYFKYAICASVFSFLHACSHTTPTTKIDTHGYYKVGTPYEIQGKWYHPKKEPTYLEEGVASWYGPIFHGKRTANGAKFDTNTLTAAHRTLPLPSMVRVTNLANNKSIEVMVNDRGPFAKDRIIDVSKQTAEILDFQRQGTAKVRVEFLPEKTKTLLLSMGLPSDQVEKDTSPTLFSKNDTPTLKTSFEPASQQYVQVGTFSVKENAEKIQNNLKDIGDVTLNPVQVGDKSLYRVKIGPLKDPEAAHAILKKTISKGHPDAQLVMNLK